MENLLEFLIWLKENNYYKYKDGKWYSTNDRSYMNGNQTTFYSDEEVVSKFLNSK
jgi:hypothetical protein